MEDSVLDYDPDVNNLDLIPSVWNRFRFLNTSHNAEIQPPQPFMV